MLRDKKFLILVGLLMFLPLFTVFLTSTLQSCENRGTSYNVYEKSMVRAAEKYFRINKLTPTIEGKVVKVSLSTLVNNKYIKSSESKLKDSTCTGSVTARMNGISQEKNKGGYVNYLATLECKDYKTNTLGNDLKEKLKDGKSGLNKIGDEYIFKGDKVKNYITFYDKTYRIISMNSQGLVRLIKTEYEPISRMWDNKYNIEVKQPYGKTIYKDSMILKYLTDDYFNEKKIKSDARKHLVATNTCIGKRSKTDTTISKQIDCQEVIANQFLSLLTVSDYALASTDPDCNSVVGKTCNNYNYMKSFASTTWTPNTVTENSYEALTISGGIMMEQTANRYSYYNIVMYIDGDEKIISGNGSEEEPYIIK